MTAVRHAPHAHMILRLEHSTGPSKTKSCACLDVSEIKMFYLPNWSYTSKHAIKISTTNWNGLFTQNLTLFKVGPTWVLLLYAYYMQLVTKSFWAINKKVTILTAQCQTSEVFLNVGKFVPDLTFSTFKSSLSSSSQHSPCDKDLFFQNPDRPRETWHKLSPKDDKVTRHSRNDTG